jgi:hypothetical protein
MIRSIYIDKFILLMPLLYPPLKVMQAASHPPVALYSFFLTSLLETVRLNICECLVASYRQLSLTAATEILMFSNVDDTAEFFRSNYPDIPLSADSVSFTQQKATKTTEESKSHRLIDQTLAYAAELERIV